MKIMPDAELIALVRKCRDSDGMSFEGMEKKFKADGIVSKRTRQPMKAHTFRFIYYYGRTGRSPTKQDGSKVGGLVPSAETNKFRMIAKILDMDMDPKDKVALMESVVREF